MSESGQLTCPIVTRGARFHADKAGGLQFEESQQLRATKRPVKQNSSILGNAVNMENVLGQILADCGDLYWVAPFMRSLDGTALCRISAVGAGAIHPIYNTVRPHSAIGNKRPITLMNHLGETSPPR